MELRKSGAKLVVGLFFLALCAGICVAEASESKSSNLYVELDESNFETFVDNNPFVLVMYYGTFSKKSKALLPLFTGLGLVDFLKKREIKIARINAGKYDSIKRKFIVEKLPSFALFAHSVQIGFKDDFSQKGLIRFVQEKLLYREEEIQSLQDVSFEHHDFAVAFHTNDDSSFLLKAMRGIKMKHYSWNVYRVRDGSGFKGKEGVLALRHHDSFKTEYSGSTKTDSPAIERFLVDSEFPDWSIYNKKTNHWIEEEGYPVLAVLYDGQNLPRTDMVTAAKDLGKQYKHTIITVFVRRDQAVTSATPILKELAGEDLTEVDAFIIAPTSPYHKKYLLRHDYKSEVYSTARERLEDFIEHYENGHLDRFHMTQVVSPAKKKVGPNLEILTSRDVEAHLLEKFDRVYCVLLHNSQNPNVGCPVNKTLKSFHDIADKFKAQSGIYFYTYDTDLNESEVFEYFSPNRIVFFEPEETYHKEYKLDANVELGFDQFAGFLMQNLG